VRPASIRGRLTRLRRATASSRTIVVAGAGIAGLTAALALAAKDFRVVVIDKAERLDETGAGIQLSPNASNVLIGLGLAERLRPAAIAVDEIHIKTLRNRRVVDIPLGRSAELRFGAPYWIIHRGDLQAALLEAAQAHPDISLELGLPVDRFVSHANGVTVQCLRNDTVIDRHGIALIGADGLWSTLRQRLGDHAPPRFSGRTAWRATLPAKAVDPEFRQPAVNLWLGGDTHLVVYPVKGRSAVNLVAIAGGTAEGRGWSTKAARTEVLARFSRWFWKEDIREILALPDGWLKWPLYDRPPLATWGRGRMTLIGDAAHPMLPLLAQGAGMAIEDAAVLADSLADSRDDIAGALRRYEGLRQPRTARVQRGARLNNRLYHFSWPVSMARNLALKAMGGQRLLNRYDWIYDWRQG
jgi:salicylate hydroxylase